jgi:hypothetical protein
MARNLVIIQIISTETVKYLVANATRFLYLYLSSYLGTVLRGFFKVDEEQIYIKHFAWGLLVVFSAGCGLVARMHWSCIDEFRIGF